MQLYCDNIVSSIVVNNPTNILFWSFRKIPIIGSQCYRIIWFKYYCSIWDEENLLITKLNILKWELGDRCGIPKAVNLKSINIINKIRRSRHERYLGIGDTIINAPETWRDHYLVLAVAIIDAPNTHTYFTIIFLIHHYLQYHHPDHQNPHRTGGRLIASHSSIKEGHGVVNYGNSRS